MKDCVGHREWKYSFLKEIFGVRPESNILLHKKMFIKPAIGGTNYLYFF